MDEVEFDHPNILYAKWLEKQHQTTYHRIVVGFILLREPRTTTWLRAVLPRMEHAEIQVVLAGNYKLARQTIEEGPLMTIRGPHCTDPENTG